MLSPLLVSRAQVRATAVRNTAGSRCTSADIICRKALMVVYLEEDTDSHASRTD
jgi:hypothetical protein